MSQADGAFTKILDGVSGAKIWITPCCKSRHWHYVNRSDLPDGIVRCEL